MSEIEAFIFSIGIAITLAWLYIGWRAMKAHAKIADQAERTVDLLEQSNLMIPDTDEDQSQVVLYREFLRANPEVDELSSKDRHDQFRIWQSEQESAK